MAKDPAFLFYPNDWIGGTMGMTFEEKGAYMELLMMQFNRGHMDGHMIGQVVGQMWDKIKAKFIQDTEGKWYNVRLEEEQIKRKAFTNSRKNNLKGENQYTKKRGHMDGHTTSHMEDESVNVNKDINNKINIAFDIFWNLYNKKVGSKNKCQKKWNKLKNDQRQKIIDTLPVFLAGIKDKQFQPFPETYLNQERWNDEIKTVQTVKKMVM
jgi:uncharacterized protein YdaU (DUF1376 family)